jgi:hypothetical protein
MRQALPCNPCTPHAASFAKRRASSLPPVGSQPALNCVALLVLAQVLSLKAELTKAQDVAQATIHKDLERQQVGTANE